MSESWLVAVAAGLFGLIFGSFLNVCTLRWPRNQSVVRPRSRCPGCEALIAWYDNVPVLSWLVLGGRCRHCAERISVQYPLVELTTGLVWAGLFWYYGPTWEAARGAIFLTILFGVAVSDARFYIIPDEFTLGGALIGLAMSLLPGGIDWRVAALGGVVGYVALWLVGTGGTWLIRTLDPSRLEEAGVDSALGGGDIKMMMMVGTFLGPWGVGASVFFGSVLALVIFGPISYLTKRLIPLGIFLAAGAAFFYGWGDAVLDWYLNRVLGMQ